MRGEETGRATAPFPLSDEQMVRKIVGAALRRAVTPFELRLAMQAWREIRETDLEQMARFYGEE